MAYVTVAPQSDLTKGYLVYVDLRRNRVVARVNVGPNPEGFAFDRVTGLGYVSNYAKRGAIRVIDIRHRKVVQTLPAGLNPFNLAVVTSGQRRLLVVLNNGTTQPARGSIDIWNLKTMRRARRIPVSFSPAGLASIGTDRMLVGSFASGAAWVLDLNKLKLVRRVTVPVTAVNGLASGTKHIYVTGLDGISVLDRRTLKPVGPVIKPLPPGVPLGVATFGDVAYVVNNGAPGATRNPPCGVCGGNTSAPFPAGALQILRGTTTLGSRKLGRDAQDVAVADGNRKLLVTARLDGTLWVIPRP
jgi:DNA-binding beta-propeller fold protein YncE